MRIGHPKNKTPKPRDSLIYISSFNGSTYKKTTFTRWIAQCIITHTEHIFTVFRTKSMLQLWAMKLEVTHFMRLVVFKNLANVTVWTIKSKKFALFFSGAYRVLTSGFQLPREPWKGFIGKINQKDWNLFDLTLSYTGFFGLAGHGGDGIHYTFITLVLFDGFELNLVQ